MTERESWVPPTCGRCGIFYGMALKEDESDMMAKEKSLVGFCEWREGVVGGWETPLPNCGCIDVSFVRGVSYEVTRRGLRREKIEEIRKRLETVMLQRAGLFLGE